MNDNEKVIKALEAINEMIIGAQLHAHGDNKRQADIEKQTLSEILGRLEIDVRGHQQQLDAMRMSVTDTLRKWPDMRIIMPAETAGDIVLCYINQDNHSIEEIAFRVNIESDKPNGYTKITLDQRISNEGDKPIYRSEMNNQEQTPPMSLPIFFKSFFKITNTTHANKSSTPTIDKHVVEKTLTTLQNKLNEIEKTNSSSLRNLEFEIWYQVETNSKQPTSFVTSHPNKIILFPSKRNNEVAICFYNPKNKAPAILSFQTTQIITMIDSFFTQIVKHVKTAQELTENRLVRFLKKLFR